MDEASPGSPTGARGAHSAVRTGRVKRIRTGDGKRLACPPGSMLVSSFLHADSRVPARCPPRSSSRTARSSLRTERTRPPQARVRRLRSPIVGAIAVLVHLAGCAAPAGGTRLPPSSRRGTDSSSGSAPSVNATAELPPTARPAPSPASGTLPSRAASVPDGVPVDGSLRFRYRGRWTDGEDDHELYSTLNLNAGDPGRHAVTAHFLGRAFVPEGGSGDVFHSLGDTGGDDVSGILYHGYLDFHRLPRLRKLRLGRQQTWMTPVFATFDGALAEAGDPAGLRAGIYGGMRAQYYDHSGNDDLVAGTFGEARPWEGGRVRLDYMYLEDEERMGSDRNDLLGLGLWQLVSPRANDGGGVHRPRGTQSGPLDARPLRGRRLADLAPGDLLRALPDAEGRGLRDPAVLLVAPRLRPLSAGSACWPPRPSTTSSR